MNITNKYDLSDENGLIALLKQGDMEAYERIYHAYWSRLYAYVYNRLKHKEAAEEIIQEVFFSLWQKHRELELTHSLSAYLFAAVRYQVLNYIRNAQTRKHYATHFAQFRESLDNSSQERLEARDLKNAVATEVDKLPEKCRQVFKMSRQEHRSIRDIAAMLNISHKTVENHLTKALKHLRMALGQHFF